MIPGISLMVVCKQAVLGFLASATIGVCGGRFWEYRAKVIRTSPGRIRRFRKMVYRAFMDRHSFYIGIGAKFSEVPVFPHGLNGIHISNQAEIGRNVVIFQQVTIGSNTLPGHSACGSPKIGDNVYIGAGAKIIGDVVIGENCRIGANAVVVKSMPANTTAVAAATRFITHEHALNNDFIPVIEK